MIFPSCLQLFFFTVNLTVSYKQNDIAKMARLVKPLSQTQVNSAKPKSKMYKLSDGGGLALWIYPTGRKVWRIEYTRRDGRRDTLTIGKYPEIGLADARKQRDEARTLIAHGVDPKRDLDNKFLGLKEVAEQWLVRKKTEVSAGYADKLENALKLNIYKQLSKLDFREIKPVDIVKVLSIIEDRGSYEQLLRTRQILKNIFEFAISRGICEYNPVASIGTNAFIKPKRTHQRALKPDEMPEMLKTLYESKTTYIVRSCIIFQLLTMSRPSEAILASWPEIDFKKQVWVIPARRMKMKRDHVVPLSGHIIKLLNDIKLLKLDDFWIFAAEKGGHIHKETPRLAFKKLGINTTAHGLRSLASTALNESNKFRPDVIEAALAHIDQNRIRAAYNRSDYFHERKEMMYWWSDYVYSFINEYQ